jgi:Fur family transcriptional regulator, zinc uptake regulator
MDNNHDLINQAKILCEKKRERLTKPRLEVLKIIAKSHKPLGAYEILSKLQDAFDSPKPPTVYRAIDFWLEMGFIHRIESINAYVACDYHHSHQGVQFTICDDCGTVMEVHLDEVIQFLQHRLSKDSFVPLRWNLEIHGQCSNCHRI